LFFGGRDEQSSVEAGLVRRQEYPHRLVCGGGFCRVRALGRSDVLVTAAALF